MTKICDFPYPIYDQKFDSLFMAVAAGTLALNLIFEGLLMMRNDENNDEKVASKKHTQFKGALSRNLALYKKLEGVFASMEFQN